jgi:hypothetical protein
MKSAACALRFALLVPIGLLASCFHQEGPEDPSPIPQPTLVSVRVEYRQPNGCLGSSPSCDRGPVVFTGSWMSPQGIYTVLTRTPGTFIWTGTVTNVPSNFPPIDQQPYFVRIIDPFLSDTATGGATADRLQVGGQLLTRFYEYGTPAESGLIYIDVQGVGHNPY